MADPVTPDPIVPDEGIYTNLAQIPDFPAATQTDNHSYKWGAFQEYSGKGGCTVNMAPGATENSAVMANKDYPNLSLMYPWEGDLTPGDYMFYADVDNGAAGTELAVGVAKWYNGSFDTWAREVWSHTYESANSRAILEIPVTLAAGDIESGRSIFVLHRKSAYVPSNEQPRVYGLRVAPGTESDGLGIFSGNSESAGRIVYSWTGEPYESKSEADVGAGPVARDITDRVITLISRDPDDDEAIQLANDTITAITAMVKSYTRGNGFTPGEPDEPDTIVDDIEAVILTASVRYMANPSGLQYRAGSEYVQGAFSGWSLAETFVLNNYRKRWA